MSESAAEASKPTATSGEDGSDNHEGEATVSSEAGEAVTQSKSEERKGAAIIVPYRDLHTEQQRAAHLEEFIRRVPEVLSTRPFKIFIIEQSDDGRKFNRGKLLNIGFDLAVKEGYDVFIFHDVDLIPSVELVPYYTDVPANPVHIARVWGRYSNNPKYIGGAVAFSADDFRKINGFPNTFWGWGGEDDEMYKRIQEVKLAITSPKEGSLEDLERLSLKEKLDVLRENRDWKCNVRWEVLDEHAKTWQTNGLADLSYQVLKSQDLNPHAIKHTVDVQLNGGHWTDDQVDPKPPHQPKQPQQQGKHRHSGGRGGGWREREGRDGDRDGKRPRHDDDRGRSDRDRDDRRR